LEKPPAYLHLPWRTNLISGFDQGNWQLQHQAKCGHLIMACINQGFIRFGRAVFYVFCPAASSSSLEKSAVPFKNYTIISGQSDQGPWAVQKSGV
jgi:hypothetical protein